MYEGLSLDQAPPIGVVFRFFLTLPLFGIALSALMIFFPTQVLSVGDPISLAALHLLFLGVLSMGMMGALFQMHSVLGGKPLPHPVGNARIIHTLFTVGIVALVSAFITQLALVFVIASVFLGSSLVYFFQRLFPLLLGKNHNTLGGMRLSLIALLVTVIVGIVMASAYAFGDFSAYHATLRTIHYSFGVMGWMALLIIYVAFQVVEMFYVTASYSAWCQHNVGRIVATALVLKALWLFCAFPFPWIFDLMIGLLLVGFIATTLKRLTNRKRRVREVSIWFWLLGIGLLGGALGAYGLSIALASPVIETMSLIAFGLFVLSIMMGMMGKIIPFLVWFHLNAQGFKDTPMMSSILPPKTLMILFALLGITAFFGFFSPLLPWLLSVAGSSSMVMFIALEKAMLGAKRAYDHTLNCGEKWTFEIPTTVPESH